MITTMPAPYREPEDKTLKWVIIFVLLSLLAHLLLLGGILIITRLIPAPKLDTPMPKEDTVELSLLPTPAPPPKPIFVPTQKQLNAPHKLQPIESANDTVLQTRSKLEREKQALMPDIDGRKNAPDMNTSPHVVAPKTPQVATTQPTPRQAQPQKPAPPTPKPQLAPKVVPRPLPPQPKPAPTKVVPQAQQIDPETGLPVLPPISAQTMAPPDQAQPLAPAPSQQQVAGSIHGALGRSGDNSAAAMATELGKYKQYVYEVVGSYWYPSVDQKFGTIGVGMVHVQFTINKDGTLSDVKILEGDNQTILREISVRALRSPAPFNPFSPAMVKEVGDSYTDDFTFSVY
jgi:outer membrane biosynthesis protein TonB